MIRFTGLTPNNLLALKIRFCDRFCENEIDVWKSDISTSAFLLIRFSKYKQYYLQSQGKNVIFVNILFISLIYVKL
jgi:hypothetical protein